MSKHTTNTPNDKGKMENIFPEIKFDKQNVIFAGSDQYNRFGLDLTNPDIIKFEENNIEFEIRGGVLDSSLTQMKVGLNIQKKFNTSAVEIYRAQTTDLFNENQLEYTITQASARIKVDKEKLRNALYSLASKLDEYKKDKIYSTPQAEIPKTSSKIIKDVKDFLKAPNLEQNLVSLFERSGIPDGKLGLKLFIISLSRLTHKPLHTILQGSILLSHEVCKLFSQVIPEEDYREATSLSPTVISHVPYPNYWNKKVLVMHQLESALGKKDSTLEEYMTNDHLSRFITEQNQKTGAYKMEQKKVNDNFSVLGYTSKDFHKVFTSSNVICLPLCNTKEIKQKINELELRQHAGLLDEDEIHSSIQTLRHIQRVLEPIKIVNTYIEQIDFQEFFDNDVKKIRQFMQLTNLVTMLHRFQLNPKKKNGELYFEVEPMHMLLVLDLFKELWVANYDELYFQVLCTLRQIKSAVKQKFKEEHEDSMFTEKEIQGLLKMNPSTLNRHMQKLTLYNKLQRVNGNNRTGYYYKVVSWSENEGEKDKFQNFKTQIQDLSNSFVSQV